MDLNQLANLGEFIGGIAVLVTLVYLAAQVRSSARDQRVASMRQATREMATVNESVGQSDEKAALWLKGCQAFQSLSPAERLRFSTANGHVFRTMEQLFYQGREGSIDREVWSGFMNQLRDIAAYPGVQAWWATRRHWFGDQFRGHVEAQMSADDRPSMFGE